ncbi:hypothetical protein Lal_00016428 [Lupinus albus]|nr:hypothetical protein Lal_00016428 [Lupinus albus]
MSSPAEFYHSLPPICKAYGTACLVATAAYQIGLYNPVYIALVYEHVFYRFQIWRLFTNFFFLGPFSINFGIRLLMIARYGVQLEKGPFDTRTADFLWMMTFGAFVLLVLSAIPIFWSPFLAISLVFMLVYVWSREFPNAQINLYGLVSLKAFYLPWAMFALDVIFGSPLMPNLLGIIAGHLYYFLTVLHPLAGGKNILKTPVWIHKLVTRWRIGAPPPVSRGQPTNNAQQDRGHHLSASAIIGHDGSIWAQSSSFPQFKAQEVSDIMKDFDEPGHLAPTGLHLAGAKYMVIQGESGAVIRGKKGSGGVTIKKTGQALVFGVYEEPVTPGQCNMVVERLGDYLIDQGL